MEIKIDDLWQYCGVDVHVTEALSNEYLPQGLYTFMERDIDGSMRLFRGGIFCNIDEWDDDDMITINPLTAVERIDNLVEAHASMCIGLIKDGWSTENKHLDLTPFLTTLASYKALQTILNT